MIFLDRHCEVCKLGGVNQLQVAALIYWHAKIVRRRAMSRTGTPAIAAGHGSARCRSG